MSLDPAQFQALHEALLDAFDRDELRTMVRVYLGRRLEVISGGDTLSAQISSLIEWADRKGYILDLINGARKANPKNPLLGAFVDEYKTLSLGDIIEEDRTTIEIVVTGSPDKAILEHMLNLALLLQNGTIKITKMTPVNSTQIRIELPKSKLLILYSMLENSLLSDIEVLAMSLRGTNLASVDLAGANLAGADLSNANLADANLTGANLAGAFLVGANLAGANLRDADLTRVFLADANLKNADLRGADLTMTTLTGANLADAKIKDVDPKLTLYSNETRKTTETGESSMRAAKQARDHDELLQEAHQYGRVERKQKVQKTKKRSPSETSESSDDSIPGVGTAPA